MAIDIGLIAFNKFYDVLTDNDKDHLPKWKELGKVQQDAWRAAAVAVLQHIDEAKKQMEEHPELIG